MTFCVVAEAATREPHRLIAASIGLAVPIDRGQYGYLSEHHSFGEKEESAGDYAEELAADMLATTLGLEFHQRAWADATDHQGLHHFAGQGRERLGRWRLDTVSTQT